MSEPDVNSSLGYDSVEEEEEHYESDEYYDDEGRRVVEADYPSRTRYVLEEDDGMVVDANEPECKTSQDPNCETSQEPDCETSQDPNCETSQEPEMTEIKVEVKTEEPSDDDDGPPDENDEEEEEEAMKEFEVKSKWSKQGVREPEPNPQKPFTPRADYTMAEMTPTVRDPLCKSRTELALFWPVYVDNFWCENFEDEFGCVKKYFAWKGLHVRWWYRKKDDYYKEFQSRARIYDMLVYFVSEQDAKLAIELCHRDNYLGYTLNVFPGRAPVYFDPNLSVLAQKMKSGRVYSEYFFEQHIKRLSATEVDVKCTVKFNTKTGAMEFASAEHKKAAQSRIKLFNLGNLPAGRQLQKQRFLEQDVQAEIEAHLTFNPAALKFDREEKFAKFLLTYFRRPEVDPNQKLPIMPLRGGPNKRGQQGHFRRKLKKMERQIDRSLAAGIKPKCYGKRHKKRFNKMVEQSSGSAEWSF